MWEQQSAFQLVARLRLERPLLVKVEQAFQLEEAEGKLGLERNRR
jgi:hypothetical protein